MKLLTTAIMAFAVIATPIEKEKKSVNTSQSTILWKGYKVTGSHQGTIAIKSGVLEFDNETLVGGSFVMDMPSITVTDLEGEYKGKLEGHLKSDDFFGVEKHTTSTLTFTDVKSVGKNAYEITADLTVKSITHPVTFKLSVYGSQATASLKIDRTKYNIRYGSSSFFDDLKDKAIYDEFDIVADLQF